jgi:hypothetical protein
MGRLLARMLPGVIATCSLIVSMPRPARAFGDTGAFDPRVLLAGGTTGAARPNAPARWSWELVQRTSAPARIQPSHVRADESSIVDGPFLWWSGTSAVKPLTAQEISGLRRFFSLGGLLLVDDASVEGEAESSVSASGFTKTAREQIARVLPESSPIALAQEHAIYKSYYLVRRPEGRVPGPRTLEAIVRAGKPQVIYSAHDLGGALARNAAGTWEHPVMPGGDVQRERAIRLAVNLAMYVLCSNYKDDQVHAPFLMRRRASTALP